MQYRDKFIVEPGSRVKLERIDVAEKEISWRLKGRAVVFTAPVSTSVLCASSYKNNRKTGRIFSLRLRLTDLHFGLVLLMVGTSSFHCHFVSNFKARLQCPPGYYAIF